MEIMVVKDASPSCEVCLDLKPELFKQRWPTFGLEDYMTKYNSILESSSKSCRSCLVLKRVIESFEASPLPPHLYLAFVTRSEAGSEPILRIGLRDKGDWKRQKDLIELFSSVESPTPWNIIGSRTFRNVEDDSSSPACISLARSWIKECIQSHQSCQAKRESRLPTRVIYVGSSDIEPRLHLSRGEVAPYIALSYCWGSFLPLTTESVTLEKRLDRLPFSDLPKTFRDAVVLTRELGVKYLWIDSLCIIQDSQLDWEIESSNMADVYSQALVVISADDGKDSNDGFLGPRDERANKSTRISYPTPEGNDQSSSYVYARPVRLGIREYFTAHTSSAYAVNEVAHTAQREHIMSVLDTRGWVFQERLLSPRTLHYTAAEMSFECRQCIQCECSRKPYTKSPNFFLKNLNKCTFEKGLHWMQWIIIVENFTKRDLTFSKDRLPALSGVAATMEYPADDYVCGLWKPEFLVGLLWQVPRDIKGSCRSQCESPSWSWSSVSCRVVYNHDDFKLDGEWAEILDINIEKTTSNPYGPGRGFAILRGPLGEAVVKAAPPNTQSRFTLELSSQKIRAMPPQIYLYLDLHESFEAVAGEIVYPFRVFTGQHTATVEKSYYLVLKRVMNNTYSRVGLGFCLHNVDEWKEDFTISDVQIR